MFALVATSMFVFPVVRAGGHTLAARFSEGMRFEGGMLGLPTTEWRAKPWVQSEALTAAPASAPWRRLGEIEHTFTHFALTLQVYRADAEATDPNLVWLPVARALAEMPSVFSKALRLAL